MKRKLCFCILGAFFLIRSDLARAEIKLLENKDYILNFSPYLRTDVVTLKNNIGLDNKKSDDNPTYLGIDYSLAFDLKNKDSGPQFYLKLERDGPYDYDAPLFTHNTLRTSTARVERYTGKGELFPQVKEYWLDLPLKVSSSRAKSGLFTYQVGNGFSLNGSYQNYGLNVYAENKGFKWDLYYCRPDLSHKELIGPRIKQEQEQGIAYERSKADFFAADVNFNLSQQNNIQPYAGILLDRTNSKRANTFSIPTHDDKLGTIGFSWNWDKIIKELSLQLEMARNFGKAKSSNEAFKDVVHSGYLIYTKAGYKLNKVSAHSEFVFASGNKVETEMADNGDTVLTSGKNRAFSVYSPLNTNLADSIYPNVNNVPLVAMGGGNGLNYGIPRPGTFNDARLFENLIATDLGFDYNFTDKLSCTFDWWYLMSQQKGVGTFEGVAKKLSPDLGHEVDLSFNYTINDKASLSLLTGYFFPGRFYKENRDDTGGSLFTPFVRGDGHADGAYQIELSLTLTY